MTLKGQPKRQQNEIIVVALIFFSKNGSSPNLVIAYVAKQLQKLSTCMLNFKIDFKR